MAYVIVCDHTGCDASIKFPEPEHREALDWLLIAPPKHQQHIDFYIFQSLHKSLTAGIPNEQHYCPTHLEAYKFLHMLAN